MKKNLHIGWMIGGSLLVTITVLASVWLVRLPSPERQLVVISPSSVSIISPPDGGLLLLDDYSSIDVRAATSDPVDSFELWVDGIQISSLTGEPLPSELFLYSVSFSWLADTTGAHTVIVRAVGSDWTEDSNAVRVTVVDLAGPMGGSPYTPQEGETLAVVAEHFGLPPMLLAVANPQIPDLVDPLSPDRPVLIPDLPVPVDQTPPDDPQGMYEGGTPDPTPPGLDRARLWFELNLASTPSRPPAAPEVFRWLEGCSVRLYVRDNSDNELGFFVYRLDPGSSSFARVATLGAHNGAEFFQFQDVGLFGAFDYYVAAFNAAGESASGFTHAVFSDPTCAPAGTAVMMASRVTMRTTQAAEKAYCYYSLQEGSWSRFPSDPDAFVYPTENGFDLSRMLADTALSPGSPLAVECWGWSGSRLVSLGKGSGLVGDTPGDLSLADGLQPLDLDIQISRLDWKGFTPALPAGLGDLSIVRISPPYGLKRTVTVETCANHFMYGYTVASRTACADAISAGMNILVWDWDPTCTGCASKDYLPPSAIAGYKIYQRTGSGLPILVATTTTGPWQTVVFLPSSVPSPEAPYQYFVRAYSGPYSSPNSNVYTWTNIGTGLESMYTYATIKPIMGQELGSLCDLGVDPPDRGLDSNMMLVGFQHLFSPGCGYEDRYYRAQLTFDLGPAAGHMVYTSRLSYSQFSGTSSVPNQSCAASLFTITGVGSGGVPATSLLKVLPMTGSPGSLTTIDTTSLADGWTRGLKPNLGLLVIGRDETLPKTDNNSCWTIYNTVMLTITFFK